MTHSGYWAAAEPRARDLRQDDVEHRPGLPRADAAGADGGAAPGRAPSVHEPIAPVPARAAGRRARRRCCRCWPAPGACRVTSHGGGAAVRRWRARCPAARVHALEQELPAPTRGEGVLETWFDHYAAGAGSARCGRAPGRTPWTARNTCCTSTGGSSRPRRRGPRPRPLRRSGRASCRAATRRGAGRCRSGSRRAGRCRSAPSRAPSRG